MLALKKGVAAPVLILEEGEKNACLHVSKPVTMVLVLTQDVATVPL